MQQPIKGKTMPDDVTNRVISKLVSVESLVLLVAVSVAYGTLSTTVKALDEKGAAHATLHAKDVVEIKSEQSANTKSLNTVTGKIILIENNLQHLKEAQDQLKADNKEILTILRNQ